MKLVCKWKKHMFIKIIKHDPSHTSSKRILQTTHLGPLDPKMNMFSIIPRCLLWELVYSGNDGGKILLGKILGFSQTC